MYTYNVIIEYMLYESISRCKVCNTTRLTKPKKLNTFTIFMKHYTLLYTKYL